MTPTTRSRLDRPATAGTGPAPIRFIRDIYAEKLASGRPVISVEFFPPKTPKGDETLFDRTLPALQAASPDFYSVTYGAGGSTRDKTLAVADRIQREHRTTTMAHLTCVSTSKADIERYLQEARDTGIRNILALRGDPPQDGGELARLEGGFEYSYQLVRCIKAMGDFSIGTAGFPESHIACKDGKQVDWQRLKAKIDQGADFVLTQLFFDNDDYFTFRDYLVETLGVSVPITPGVLPILNTQQIERFTEVCGATLPTDLRAKLEAYGDDADAVADFGVEFATRQCEALLAGGAPGLHLYSLNKAHAATQIIQNLGLRA
ncbi:MAG: methylenetetrahydrofolate reductase [NAD(P)H] [Vicinamibacterales bacterium]|jgi:methylenetetrahydrofolate reductase (NADPH)|nr:methylenetetrahydrofolate reductase [NAD(P)H] [Vicinamibacterales bacterium]